MKESEARGIVTKISSYYPGWLKGMTEEEGATTQKAWADELTGLGAFREVWPLVLEALRAKPGPFPPGVFEIGAYVRRSFKSQRLHHKEDQARLERSREAERYKALSEEKRASNCRRFAALAASIKPPQLEAPKTVTDRILNMAASVQEEIKALEDAGALKKHERA